MRTTRLPGQVPVIGAGTELVEFGEAEEYARTMSVVAENPAPLAT